MNDQITIIIPTYNRCEYLLRLLTYLARQECPYAIIIADSSSDNYKTTNRANINKFDKLSLKIMEFEKDYLVFKKWADAAKTVTTPYSVLCADDDFIIIPELKRSLDFLEGNPEYVVCSGYSFRHKVSRDATGQVNIDLGTESRAHGLENDQPIGRMIEHFKTYSHSVYSLHRTDVLANTLDRTVLNNGPKGDHGSYFNELLQSFLVIMAGKVKRLPHFTLWRSGNAGNPGWIHQVMRPEYSEMLLVMKDVICSELDKVTPQFSPKEIRSIFEAAFANYILTGMGSYKPPEELHNRVVDTLGVKIEPFKRPPLPENMDIKQDQINLIGELVLKHPAELEGAYSA